MLEFVVVSRSSYFTYSAIHKVAVSACYVMSKLPELWNIGVLRYSYVAPSQKWTILSESAVMLSWPTRWSKNLSSDLANSHFHSSLGKCYPCSLDLLHHSWQAVIGFYFTTLPDEDIIHVIENSMESLENYWYPLLEEFGSSRCTRR